MAVNTLVNRKSNIDFFKHFQVNQYDVLQLTRPALRETYSYIDTHPM